jgi:hypothetical protein
MLDKPKGSWYYKNMSERPNLSLNQAVGVDRPELTPLERSNILNEGGSLQEGGGHDHPWRILICGFSCGRRPCSGLGVFLVGGGHAGLMWDFL